MSSNSIGKIFNFTTWGESHGKAIGCVVDGVPSKISLNNKDLQKYLDKRRPGQSKYTSQRKEADQVEILSGVFEGFTTGHPISLIIMNALSENPIPFFSNFDVRKSFFKLGIFLSKSYVPA